MNIEMTRTGIFFHDLCRDRDIDWLLAGRLVHFPELLEKRGLLALPQVKLFTSPATSLKLLSQVHTPRLIWEVENDKYFETALYSSGGTVAAAAKIKSEELTNAFVFTGSADHHAGRDRCWGGCHFNGAALAIANLREKFGPGRFAIVDTDHHHGDGTRDILGADADVLHICFCSTQLEDRQSANYDIPASFQSSDAEYLEQVKKKVPPLIREFQPELIFWEYGYDNTRGDYGDIGVTRDLHLEIARLLCDLAQESTGGRMIAILCGGSSPDTADYTIPEIIRRLATSGS